MRARSEQWCAPWAWLLHNQQHLSLPSWQQTICCYFARNSRRSIKLDGKGEPKGARRVKPVKYTAAKLHEKGVLLGIDDLQTNQWVWLGVCTEHTRPLITPIKPDSHSLVSCGLWRELHLVSQGVPLITDDRGKHVYCHLLSPHRALSIWCHGLYEVLIKWLCFPWLVQCVWICQPPHSLQRTESYSENKGCLLVLIDEIIYNWKMVPF